ncbi:MAG: DUF1508 domain-containing protein [Verrucomicrobiales bacterium]
MAQRVPEPDIAAMKDRWEFYKDAKNEWRWRRIAGNNRIVGASSEGYKNRLDCVANASRNGCEDSADAEPEPAAEEA